MKFWLFHINQGACLDPVMLTRIAQQAEAAGLESLWAGEHVVLPDPRVPPSPMEPTDPILDPVIALTFAAAVTRTLRLGTGVTSTTSTWRPCAPSGAKSTRHLRVGSSALAE